MRTTRTGLSIAITLLIIGCSSADNGANKQAPNRKPVALSQADSGGKFQLQPGQTLVIALEENPTTGYRWQIAAGVENILKLLSREYQQSETEPGKVGVGGVATFKFEAAGKGSTELKMIYIRATANTDTAGQFNATIEIK
jgi:inhibitor of cysteine peptidase